MLTGGGGGAQQTGAQLYLADIATPSNRARTMAPLGIAFSAGAALGPAVGGWIGVSHGLGAPFFLVGGMMGCAALNNYLFCPETRPPRPADDAAAAAADNTGGGDSAATRFWQQMAQGRPLLNDSRMQVRKNGLFCPLLVHKNDHFTKTGSG